MNLLLPVLAAAALSQTPPELPGRRSFQRESPTPVYLPRAATAGALLGDRLVVPQVRLLWELPIWFGRNDVALLTLEGGGGYGVVMPALWGPGRTYRMTFLYEHPILLGAGYRATYPEGWHWGLQLGTGPLFFGGRIENLPTENRVVGTVEGRVLFGYRFGALTYALSVGYHQPWEPALRSNVAVVLGGWAVALQAEWL
jgi:hypothetical protein